MSRLKAWFRKNPHRISTFILATNAALAVLIVSAIIVVIVYKYFHYRDNKLDNNTIKDMLTQPSNCLDGDGSCPVAAPINTSLPKTFGAAYDACEAKLPSDTLSGYLGCCVDTVADDGAKACVANQLADARSDGAPGDAQVLEQYRTCAAMNAGNMRDCFKRIL